jgi:hypothetical protein
MRINTLWDVTSHNLLHFTNVSEVRATSVFRFEEKATHITSKKDFMFWDVTPYWLVDHQRLEGT